jgi:hypothetical protein
MWRFKRSSAATNPVFSVIIGWSIVWSDGDENGVATVVERRTSVRRARLMMAVAAESWVRVEREMTENLPSFIVS